MKKILFILLAIFLFYGIYSQQYSDNKKKHIVVIPKGSHHTFWDFIRAGVDEAVREEDNIKMTWRGPAYNDDTESQIKLMQIYTQSSVDAIILVPTDREALVKPVRKATAAGIKVIVIDSELNGNNHTAFVGTNNKKAGSAAASYMSSLTEKKLNILLLRTVKGSASTDDRAEGFREEANQHEDMKIYDDQYCGVSTGQAYHFARSYLSKQPGINAIFAVNESSAAGTLQALRALGMTEKVIFIGFDANEILLDGLKKGEIKGLILQNAHQMGYIGAKAAIQTLKNQTVEPLIYTPFEIATPQNYKTEKIQKLLFP